MPQWIVNLMITSMIFFPEKAFYEKPEDYGFQWEDVFVQTSDGVKIHGWFLRAQEEKGVLLFLHGNAGNISGRLFKAKGWLERGFSVFLVDYRSYGQSEGTIRHGEDIMRDAEAAFRWLEVEKKISPSRMILYGESLGTYPVIRLAGQYRVAALILEAPYASFRELASIHYAMIPGFLTEMLLSDFAFPNIDVIDKIKAPLLILHGDRDEVCPYEMGQRLFAKAPEPKVLFSIPSGTHNDLPAVAGEDYWEKPVEFVKKHLLL